MWLLIVAACMAYALGGHALIDPDEGRNAAIAREMRESGDMMVPHLNDLPFLDKPPLYFAAEAAAIRVLGNSETAARLPSLLAAWATVALTAWFSVHLFGRTTAWIAATAAATAPLALAMARTAIFDSLLAFFMAAALCSFYRAVESEGTAAQRRWRPWTLLAWTAIGLGVLTKGPVALLVPLLVAGAYALWRRRSLAVWHPLGWLLFLGIVLPWALAVEHRLPGFLRYALLTESWGRLTTNELRRTGPVWYFLPYLLAGFFPWIVIVAATLLRRAPACERTAASTPRGSASALGFLGLWVALPFLMFSFSQSKRPQYILPLVPALALLSAWAWSRSTPPWRGVRAAAGGWILVGAASLAAPYTRAWLELDSDLARVGKVPLLGIGLVALVAGLLSWWYSRKPNLTPVLLSLPLLALVVLTAPAIAEVARVRSARDLVNAIPPNLDPTTRVMEIEMHSPSLSFYLGRPTQLSTASAAVMGSNYIARFADRFATPDGPLQPAGAWRQTLAACAEPTIFVFRERQLGERAILARAGLPVLFDQRGRVAMGPCHEPAPAPSLPEASRSDVVGGRASGVPQGVQ